MSPCEGKSSSIQDKAQSPEACQLRSHQSSLFLLSLFLLTLSFFPPLPFFHSYFLSLDRNDNPKTITRRSKPIHHNSRQPDHDFDDDDDDDNDDDDDDDNDDLLYSPPVSLDDFPKRLFTIDVVENNNNNSESMSI